MKALFLLTLLSFPAFANAELYYYVVKAEQYNAEDSFNEIQKKAVVLASCYNPKDRRSGACMQEIIVGNISIWVEHNRPENIFLCQISEVHNGDAYTVILKTNLNNPSPKDISNGKYICAKTEKHWGARR